MTTRVVSFERPILAGGERISRSVVRARGGSAAFYPFSVEQSAERLAPRLAHVARSLEVIPQGLRGERLHFDLQLFPNFIANSHHPGQLLQTIGAGVVGTRYGRGFQRRRSGEETDAITKTLILSVDDTAIARFADVLGSALHDGRGPARNLQVIEDLAVPSASDLILGGVGEPNEEVLWDFVLNPVPTSSLMADLPASSITLARFRDLVREKGAVVAEDQVRVFGGMTYVPVRATYTQALEIAEFNALRSAQPLLAPTLDDTNRRTPTVEIPSPIEDPPESALRVAVFDGGLKHAASPAYHGRVVYQDHSGGYPNHSRGQEHGALVTSAALMGHLPRHQLSDPADVIVTHHRVFPYHGAALDQDMLRMLDVIESEVRTGAYDVVILSCAPEQVVEDDFIDRWTAAIDILAFEHDVLFLIAAGNLRGERPLDSRMQIPAGAVNSLTVGACQDHHPDGPTRANYSRTGPGRAGMRVAPTGLFFGGSASDHFTGYDGSAYVDSYGTSFAAPSLVGPLAELHALLGNRSNLNNWRAFMVHFATPAAPSDPVEAGFGRLPAHFVELLECGPNEVHVLYECELDRGETRAFDVPLPVGHAGRTEIKWTLVYTSPTECSNPVEYTQVGLEMQLRPHSHRHMMTKEGSTPRKVNVVDDSEMVAELLRDGWSLSGEPASLSVRQVGSAEAVLRAEGKWDTVQHRRHRFNVGSLHQPRIDITHLSRCKGVLTEDSDPIRLSLVVSMRCSGVPNLYQQVRATYSQLIPAIRARATVRVQS